MKTVSILSIVCLCFSAAATAQTVKESAVPKAVTSALHKNYATASHITWEKEKGNYEANWGGKSGEDNSVVYTPAGVFIEMIKAIPVSQLPKAATAYIKTHYKGAKVTEAGKVTDAEGKTTFEAQIHKKDVIFDEQGKFIKVED